MTKFQEPNFPALFSYDKDKLRTFDKDLITALSGFVMVLKSILDAGISIGDNVDMANPLSAVIKSLSNVRNLSLS